MTRRTLLLAAWYFPPDGGAGSQRPSSFSRHLPGQGWDTTVLTRGEDHPRSRLSTRDDTLLSDIGTEARVVRIEETRPIADPRGCYEREIMKTGGAFLDALCDHAAEQVPDVVLISMSPFALCKAIPFIRAASTSRIVLDLRDPWALDYWPPLRRSVQREQLRIMADAFSTVDGIVMNTPEAMNQVLSVLGPGLPAEFKERITVVQNGYSAGDFTGDVPVTDDRLTITHAGTFLCDQLRSRRTIRQRLSDRLRSRARGGIDRTGRTPYHLLEAAGLLRDTDPEVFQSLRFEFVGHDDEHLRACVADSPCPDRVRIEGYLPHAEMITRIRSAPALFLPCGGLADSVLELIVPGKTYEYLASCRPIIAALHPGDGLDLVMSSGGAFPCNPTSSDSIASALKDLHRDWSSGALDDLKSHRSEFLEGFERGRLADRMSDFLHKILSLPPVGGGT